jgi:uncharacterized protein YbjT (DUF2867 family)
MVQATDRMSQFSFVAGATGYTGREVVRLLGEKAIAHVRPDSSQLDAWRDRFGGTGAKVDTTPWELEAMTATLQTTTPAAVFALLGTTRKRAKGERLSAQEAYEKVDYGLTALLIEAAAASGCNPRFVYLSSLGVGDSRRTGYVGARTRAEEKLRASGLSYTIARPSFITGADRDENRPGERAGAAVVDGVLSVVGAVGARTVADRYRSITATDLARALVRAAFDPTLDSAILYSDSLR